MYDGILHAHSGLRWVALIAIIVAIVIAFSNYKTDKFTKGHKTTYLLALIFTHIQLIIGFYLYFTSPKVFFSESTMSNNVARFFTVEHIILMLLSIVLITVGYSRSKRAKTLRGKHSSVAIFYTLALIIMLLGIPWPFRGLGAHWF